MEHQRQLERACNRAEAQGMALRARIVLAVPMSCQQVTPHAGAYRRKDCDLFSKRPS